MGGDISRCLSKATDKAAIVRSIAALEAVEGGTGHCWEEQPESDLWEELGFGGILGRVWLSLGCHFHSFSMSSFLGCVKDILEQVIEMLFLSTCVISSSSNLRLLRVPPTCRCGWKRVAGG